MSWYVEGNKEQGWRGVEYLTPNIVHILVCSMCLWLLWYHAISPLILRTNSNQVLYESNVHKYTSMTQIKTYNVGMCTHAHPMLPNTSKEHQSNTCAPPNSKWPPKPQSSSKALQNSSKAPRSASNSANLHLQHTQTLKISLNAHKQSNL
jgi:hypothetical protein